MVLYSEDEAFIMGWVVTLRQRAATKQAGGGVQTTKEPSKVNLDGRRAERIA